MINSTLFSGICALVAVLCAALSAALLMQLVLQRGNSRQHWQRRRLLLLKQTDSSEQSAATNTATGTNRAVLDGLCQLIKRVSSLPVIRIFALPVKARIEQHRLQTLRDSCMNDLPEMVDVLLLALGAGLSIDQAFEWYLSSYDTPLAAEFRRAEQVYQVGMLSRMKAFEQLADALQEEAVLRFVNALRQAFTLGTPLGSALGTFAQEVRDYRIARLEERIAKTPVKILAPLGLCIVPAVLILLMGPVMAQVMQGMQF
ncbi:MAG: type II secretion system F family protein [Coriobacteriia bacterium]|nr:type II secretion system F family protein [Coriobacteriia bacterium]